MIDPTDLEDSDLELPPDDDSDTDLIAPRNVSPAFAKEDSYFQKIRKQLDAELHKAYAALALEQMRGDELRKELGDEPLGPQRTYSAFELQQAMSMVVLPFTGGGITTRIES